MKIIPLIVMLASAATSSLIACESCGRSPGSIIAPHGGTIEETREGHVVELIKESDQAKIYVYDHDIRPIDPNKVSIKAHVILPKKPPQEIKFDKNNDHHLGTINIDSNVHHYTIKVLLLFNNLKENVQFVIEQ